MFCPKCGTQNADGAGFCSACGAPLQNTAQTAQNTSQQPQNNRQTPQQPQYNWQEQSAPTSGLPMKWWKFLVYFALFASAVLNAISGIRTMTGAQYEGAASLVYAFYNGMKALDIFFGLALLAVGALAILTRQHLHGFKKDGPKLLLLLYGVNLVLGIIYPLFASIITGLSFSDMASSTMIVQIITSIAMIAINKSYFDKRASMFVN